MPTALPKLATDIGDSGNETYVGPLAAASPTRNLDPVAAEVSWLPTAPRSIGRRGASLRRAAPISTGLRESRAPAGRRPPNTLRSDDDLALVPSAVGEYQQARALNEDTLTRRRPALGDDHPDTLTSAQNLADEMEALGEDQKAAGWREWATRPLTDRRPSDP